MAKKNALTAGILKVGSARRDKAMERAGMLDYQQKPPAFMTTAPTSRPLSREAGPAAITGQDMARGWSAAHPTTKPPAWLGGVGGTAGSYSDAERLQKAFGQFPIPAAGNALLSGISEAQARSEGMGVAGAALRGAPNTDTNPPAWSKTLADTLRNAFGVGQGRYPGIPGETPIDPRGRVPAIPEGIPQGGQFSKNSEGKTIYTVDGVRYFVSDDGQFLPSRETVRSYPVEGMAPEEIRDKNYRDWNRLRMAMEATMNTTPSLGTGGGGFSTHYGGNWRGGGGGGGGGGYGGYGNIPSWLLGLYSWNPGA